MRYIIYERNDYGLDGYIKAKKFADDEWFTHNFADARIYTTQWLIESTAQFFSKVNRSEFTPIEHGLYVLKCKFSHYTVLSYVFDGIYAILADDGSLMFSGTYSECYEWKEL